MTVNLHDNAALATGGIAPAGPARRLGRALFTASACLSLVLCVASGWFWLTAQSSSDTFIYTSPLERDGPTASRVEWQVSRSEGRVWVGRVTSVYTNEAMLRVQSTSLLGWGHLPNTPGFTFRTGTTHGGAWGWVARGSGVGLPLPVAILLTAALPAARAAAFVRRRRRVRWSATGCCPVCGYDRRASAGRCPECGTPADVTVAA